MPEIFKADLDPFPRLDYDVVFQHEKNLLGPNPDVKSLALQLRVKEFADGNFPSIFIEGFNEKGIRSLKDVKGKLESTEIEQDIIKVKPMIDINLV